MSTFTGPLTLTALDDGRTWRLEQPLVYDIVAVPTGFETDGASVPRPFWDLLPSWGTYSRAAVVHDYLCRLLNEGTPHALAPTRRHADAVFYEAMTVCGTGLVMRWVMWAAVRVFAVLTGK